MKRKIFNVLFALVLVLSFSLVAAVPVAADPATFYVATDGSDEFGDGTEVWVDNDSSGNWTAGDTGPWLTIGHGVDTVSAGDTINVAAGEYYEESYIDIEKSLTLQGAGAEDTAIYVEDSYGFDVYLGWDGEDELAETVVIDGFYMEAATFLVWLEEVNNGSSATVSNCELFDAGDGIYCGEDTLDNGSTVNIEGNEIHGSSYGIYFDLVTGGSELNIIDNLIYENNNYGIYIYEVSEDSTVTMTGNIVGAYMDEDIEVDGNLSTGVYFEYVYDSTVTIGGTGEDAANIIGGNGGGGYGDGIYFYETDNATVITIQGNTLGDYDEEDYWTESNNGCGIDFGSTTITDSTILIGGDTREAGNSINGSTNYGIYLALAGSNVTIMNNDIAYSGDNGIYIYMSENSSVDIHYNNIVNNDYGVYNNDGYAVDAENNWWGSASGPDSEDNTFNVGEQGNGAYELVDFCPWLDAPVPDGESFAPVTSEDGDFSSIGAAIDAVTGTTITCAAGTYSEGVYIDKSLTLQGAGANETALAYGYDVRIYLGWDGEDEVAEMVVFDGFTVATDMWSAVWLETVNNGSSTNVSNNILDGATYGIYCGFDTLDNGSSVTITGNEIYDASYGINFEEVTGGSSANIIDNTVYNNSYDGVYISDVSENSTVTMTGNTVGGWYDVAEDEEYDGNGYAGVVISEVYDSTVTIGGDTEAECNFISENGWSMGSEETGITIWYTDNATVAIQGNIIGEYETDAFEYGGNYWAGIYLGGDGGLNESTVTIQDNSINDNAFEGIVAPYLMGTSLEILNNDILDNGQWDLEGNGIYISSVDEDSSVDINYNSIVNNYSYGLDYEGGDVTVDATKNWWGDVAGPYDSWSPDSYYNPYNGDTDGDSVYGDVDYIPWMIQNELAEDWNIWSRPIVPDDDSVEQMQAELEAAGVTTIYYFDSTTQLWGTDPDDSGLLDAWYIEAPDATTIRYYFSSEATFPAQKDMAVGWNFIGLAELYDMDAPDALYDAYYGTGETDLWGYSKAISPTLNGVSWIYQRESDGFAAYMLPTKGYWVFMVNNGTLGGFTSTPIVEEYD